MNIITLANLYHSYRDANVQGLSYINRFLKAMRALTERSQSLCVSAYQIQAVNGFDLSLPCPTTGEDCEPAETIVTKDKTIFVRYDAQPPFWLAFSNMSIGYPPSALYYEVTDTLIKFDDPVWGVRPDHVADMKTGQTFAPDRTQPQSSIPALLFGDQNYAHVMWNQLPLLMRLFEENPPPDYRLIVTHEPLGPIETLIPAVDPEKILRRSPSMLAETNSLNVTFITPGSTHIPRSVVERVLSSCEQRLSDYARRIYDQLHGDHRPVIWLSLRQNNRTATNQEEVLKQLILTIHERYDNFVILIDGFSTPYDVETNYDYNGPALRRAGRNARALADKLIADIATQVPIDTEKTLINICGLDIGDSLYLAQLANFYFCHHGTVQHKVGWIANCLGMVHSNSKVLKQKPEQWAASMLDKGVAPVYLNPHFVIDVEAIETDDPRKQDLRHENYEFTHTDNLIEEVMAVLEMALHRPRIA